MPTTHSNSSILDVLIIGAGPAGLTAAWQLRKKSQLSIHILEAHPTLVGGISRTESRNGYSFDIGGHRFFTKAKEVEALWQEMLPHDFLTRPRSSRIYYQRKFFSYPLRAIEALLKLGFWQSTLCVLSYIKARLIPITPVRSFHDWVSNQFGERLFRIFFKSYTEKVWGMSCDDLSADWAAQRIKGLSLFSLVITSLKRSMGLVSRSDTSIKTLIEEFRYPRRGPGMLWTAAADSLKSRDVTISMGCKATAYAWDSTEKTWTVTVHHGDGRIETIIAKHIISSAPLRETIPAITPRPRCADQIATLRYRDFITVAIMLNAKPVFDDNWIYIHEPAVLVGRIQNFASWSPEMVPQDTQESEAKVTSGCDEGAERVKSHDPSTRISKINKGCLGLEYFCNDVDDLWNQNDEQLITLARNEVIQLGLAKAEQITGGHVVRQPKAYPVYDDNYKAITTALKNEFAADYPSFHMVGRNGMHKYNNQDHAMMTAMLTAENILSGARLYDVWNVNVDAEYHEEKEG